MKLILSVLVLTCLFGCMPPKYETDQELRRELFKECMASLPAGPTETVYNDWDEVVSECKDYAYWGSQKRVN